MRSILPGYPGNILKMLSLAALSIKNISTDKLLPLIYGNLLTSSLEDFEYGKYHHLYWDTPLIQKEEHISAFLGRIYPDKEEDWQSALDEILLVLLTEDILVTNIQDPYLAYYWHRKGDKYILFSYDSNWGDIDRHIFSSLEEIIKNVLEIENEYPVRVGVSEIREKDKQALECIFPVRENGPSWQEGEYLKVTKPPSEMSITPINKITGWWIFHPTSIYYRNRQSRRDIYNHLCRRGYSSH